MSSSLCDRNQLIVACGLIFLAALTVRLFTWQDNSRDAWKVQTSVVEGYRDSARQLASGDVKTFVSDINHFGHPPGYSILLATIFTTVGEWTAPIRVVQITSDLIAVILLFLIALEILPFAAAVITGLLAAISPQFAYFSILLLPDSLVVAPILLAIYFVIRAHRQPHIAKYVIAGACIGVSCWFRSNALFLPVFVGALVLLTTETAKRWRYGAAVVIGAILVIAPIIIKNATIYQSFVPLSLGAGQTLLEGIADYDYEGRFNIPSTDLGIMRQEAERHGKPEYAQLLFGPDGIDRDRARLALGLAVIRSHPHWFAGVMVRRGVNSIRLEPVPVLATEAGVTQESTTTPHRIWTTKADWGRIQGDQSKYGNIKSTEVIDVITGADYLFQVPVKLEQGRVQLKVTDAAGETVLASQSIDLDESHTASNQPTHKLAVPFVTANHANVRLVIANFAATDSVAEVGAIELFELGPSSQTWQRYLRIPLGWLQRVFQTAWMLPLMIVGLMLMIRNREWKSLLIVLTVPAYYLIVQSTLHTERRYVYVIHFFMLLLAAKTLHKIYQIARVSTVGAALRGRPSVRTS